MTPSGTDEPRDGAACSIFLTSYDRLHLMTLANFWAFRSFEQGSILVMNTI